MIVIGVPEPALCALCARGHASPLLCLRGCDMQMTAWLNEPIDDDTVGHRLRVAMATNGWSARDVAARTGTTPFRVKLARLNIGIGDKSRYDDLLPGSVKAPRWRPLLDVLVVAGMLLWAAPFSVGWGARRAMRHDRTVSMGVLALASIALLAIEGWQWMVAPSNEWSFRSTQCVVLASLGLLAAGWTAGGLVSVRKRATMRFAFVGAMCVLPMLALYSYRTDIVNAATGTPGAMARYQADMRDVARASQGDPGYDVDKATYEALTRLDETLRSRPMSLSSLEAFRHRQAMARACDTLPVAERVSCMPKGIDAPRPVDRWAVTRDIFSRVVPEPAKPPVPGALAI